MRIGVVKCPKCGSENTWQWQREDCTIWDDSFHNTMNKEFGYKSKDTIKYKCKCGNCEHDFLIKLTLKCEIEDLIILQ